MSSTAAVSSEPPEPSGEEAVAEEGLSRTNSVSHADPGALDSSGLALGLGPDHRFRCDGCGNVTRFDVVVSATSRQYHHFDLGGSRKIEQEDVLARKIDSVTCHWCGRADAISVEPAPVAGTTP